MTKIRNPKTIIGTLLLSLIAVMFASSVQAAEQVTQPTESSNAVLATLIVTKTADTNDGVCDSDCSLREALAVALSGDTITFDAALSGQTIYLASTLTIATDLTIDGSALTSQITISGDSDNNGTGDVRVFIISGSPTVILDSLTITKGRIVSSSGGAGIYNPSGNLTVANSTISDNTAVSSPGGGIRNDGTLTVLNSTFSGNSSTTSSGGGIRNLGALTVTNSTFSGNSVPGSGGGIYNVAGFVSITITNSTFSGNSAGSSGGGLYFAGSGSVLNYANTIIANSPSGGDCAGDGTVGTNTNNLVENGGCSAALSGDPKLGALADNGGPTQTFALLAGSSAIDTGDDTICAAAPVNNLDQRGITRPQRLHCDIGAYEALPNLPPVASNDVYTTTEDIPLSISAPGVSGNDTDPNGDILEVALSAFPSHGTVILNSDGSFVYTPTADYNGTDSFAYLVYDSLPLPTIAYWPFEDQADPTSDESGNGHDGDLINGTVFSTNVPITYTGSIASLQFDGVDDRIDVTGTIPLANNSFTVAFWAKRSSLSGDSDFAVGLGTTVSANNYLHIGFRNTNTFTCAFWNNDLNTTTTYTDLNWHHWACTYDAETNRRAIFRDGVLVASDTATADFQGTGTLTLGSRGTNDHLAGLLDDVRIYDQTLPISEIANIMTTPPGTGGGDTAAVTLNITPINDAPIAVDDTYTTTQGTPLLSPIMESDLTTLFASNNSQDGNMFNLTAGANDIHLTGFDLNVNTTGSIEIAVYYKAGTYVGSQQNPNAWTHLGMFMVNAQGTDNPTFLDISSAGGITIPAGELYGLYLSVTDTALNFRYTNTSATATYSNADLTFTSGTGNAYPFGTATNLRIWNGTIYYEINPGVLLNDSDVDNPDLTAVLDTNPTHGSLFLNSNGTFVYTPTVTFAGVDTFTYLASDGVLTDTATVSIIVTAMPCQVETTGDALTDYASADESALQTAVNNASPGDTIKVAGTCTGTHLHGGETQTVYISQTLTIQGGYTYTNWLATPDPIASPTILNAQENGRVIYIPGTLTVTLDSLTLMNGNATASPGGGMYINGETAVTLLNSTFISNTASSGSAIYNFGTLAVYTTTFRQNMATTNGTLENEGDLTITASVFSNNEAFRGGGIYGADTGNITLLNTTIANNTAQEGGAIHNRGTLTITFSTLANNTATFGSAIQNWGGLSSLALSHTIMAYNSGSVNQCDDTAGTLINSLQNLITDGSCAATFTDDPLLSSLSDYGGLTETMLPQAFSPAIDATITGLYGCGTIYTTDQRGFIRPIESFCDIGAVELETNFAPIAASDTYTSPEDLPLIVDPSGVLGNDLDGDADSLTAVLDTATTTGTLTLNGDGSFIYTPAENSCGIDGFTYHANDGQANSNVVSVTLAVTCVSDSPTATDDAYVTTEDTPLSVTTPGVLGNDEDADGDGLTAVLDTTVTTGTLSFNSDGSFNYTPPANWFGTTSFTYHANDGQNDSNTAVVTLTVLSENDLPVVDVGGDETADEGEVITFSGSYSDPGLHDSVDSTQYSVFSLGNLSGDISVHWDFGDGVTTTGTLTPTHSYADNGTFTVTLTITDTEGGVNSDSLLVTVHNVAPGLENLSDQAVTAGTIVSFTAAFTDTGALDTHTAVIDWGDGTTEQGVVNQAAMTVGGSHSYATPGSYTVTLTLTDDDGGSNNQTFTVTVTASGYQLFLPVIVN